MRILAIDPFHGGSHRAFLTGVMAHSRHQWRLVPGKPVHWKWRMRSAPLELALAAARQIENDGHPDLVFCTDMLDLPQWRGLLRDPQISRTPTAVYFHENQWTYPLSAQAQPDLHYGYTNLLTAIAADACWFNSAFHRDDFLRASTEFVDRMPDAHAAHDFERLGRKCAVVPPGFSEPPSAVMRVEGDAVRIGWVSRWEHDKRPDRLVELLERLDRMGIAFELVLLGPRPSKAPDALVRLRSQYGDRILCDQFAESPQEYWSSLAQIDVVVSTADHEFFGIAICEAIWAGAAPVLPRRLSYPELVPEPSLYDDLDDAAKMIAELTEKELRSERAGEARSVIEKHRAMRTVEQIDQAVEILVGQ